MAMPDFPSHEDKFYEELAIQGEQSPLPPTARQDHLEMMADIIQSEGYDAVYESYDPETKKTELRPVEEILNPKKDVKKIVIGGIAFTAVTGALAALAWRKVRFVKREKNG